MVMGLIGARLHLPEEKIDLFDGKLGQEIPAIDDDGLSRDLAGCR